MENSQREDNKREATSPVVIAMLQVGTALTIILMLLPWVRILDGDYAGYHILLFSSVSMFTELFGPSRRGDWLWLPIIWLPFLLAIGCLIASFFVKGKYKKAELTESQKALMTSGGPYNRSTKGWDSLIKNIPEQKVGALAACNMLTAVISAALLFFFCITAIIDVAFPTPWGFVTLFLSLALYITCRVISRNVKRDPSWDE